MSNEPIVRVGWFWNKTKGRYYLIWKNPNPGESPARPTQSTQETKQNGRGVKSRLAKLATEKEKELTSAYFNPDAKITWEDFCALYRKERLPHTSRPNQIKFGNAVDIFNDVWPRHVPGTLLLEQINARLMLLTESEMKLRLSPGSVDGYILTLRAAVNWAARTGLVEMMLPPRPPETTETTLPAMRLAPVTLESLERMEEAAKKVVPKERAKYLADYMRCLWLSGGRLKDPLWIHAYRRDCHHPIGISSDAPMFAWTARQKNRTDQFAPVFLDFAKWIARRIDKQSEFLFPVFTEHGETRCDKKISAMISECGRLAGVIAEPGDAPKTATAKHFRSSAATRWGIRGMRVSEITARLRHSSEKVTKKYYIAPFDRVSIEKFDERDWIDNVDQFVDPKNPQDDRFAVICRGDGGIRTHE